MTTWAILWIPEWSVDVGAITRGGSATDGQVPVLTTTDALGDGVNVLGGTALLHDATRGMASPSSLRRRDRSADIGCPRRPRG